MKLLFLSIFSAMVLFVTSGRAILEEHKDQIRSAGIQLVETKGADAISEKNPNTIYLIRD